LTNGRFIEISPGSFKPDTPQSTEAGFPVAGAERIG